MDTRQADLLTTVDPTELGGRIRAARIASGLTQTDLAGDDVSVGYVSRIESGHRRPKVSVLTSMSERLGVSLDLLLGAASTSAVEKVRLQLDFAELALETGSLDQAQEHAEEARGLAVMTGERALVERARLLQARVLENAEDYDRAIIELEDLLGETVDRVLQIKVGIALSRCYRESGDLVQAIESAQEVLATTAQAGLAQCDEAVQLTVTMAAAYFERGDVGQAVRVCQRAIATAEVLGSPTARASAYWNASVIQGQRGQISSAVDLAQRALALLAEQSDSRNLAVLRAQLGSMQLDLDPANTQPARDNLISAANEMAMSDASPVDRARVSIALASAHLLDGDLEQAQRLSEQVHQETVEVAPNVAAQASAILGQSLAAEGRTAEAVAALQQAALLLTGIGADRFTGQQWFELAETLDEMGESEAARQAYRSAAVSSGLRASPYGRMTALNSQQHQPLPTR